MFRFLLPAMLASCFLVGCGTRLEPPPLELSYRDSLIGAGVVVQVKNTSSEPLTALEVKLIAPSGEERIFKQESLEGYASFEIGWKKLGGWQVPDGATIEVRCEGYLRPFEGTIE